MKTHHILIMVLLFSLYGCANYEALDRLPESCKNLPTFSTEKKDPTVEYVKITTNNTAIRTYDADLVPVSPHYWYDLTLQLTEPIELHAITHAGYTDHRYYIKKTDTACLSKYIKKMVSILDMPRYGYDLPIPSDYPHYNFEPKLTDEESVNLNQIRICLVDLNQSMAFRNRFIECDESEGK